MVHSGAHKAASEVLPAFEKDLTDNFYYFQKSSDRQRKCQVHKSCMTSSKNTCCSMFALVGLALEDALTTSFIIGMLLKSSLRSKKDINETIIKCGGSNAVVKVKNCLYALFLSYTVNQRLSAQALPYEFD